MPQFVRGTTAFLSKCGALIWANQGSKRTFIVKAKGKPFNLEAFLADKNGGTRIRKYKKGETIFTQGDTCDGVFYIREGSCKITVISERGKEAVAALHKKGDFFGEGCLTGQSRRLATATAMTDCELLRLDNATIECVIREQPDFAELFIAHLLARNTRVEADLVDQLFNSSEKRLARLLLLLANFGKEGKAEPIKAKISQATLAEMIGTTRSRVSTFMNKFRKLGFIDYNGDIHVHNSLLNVVLYDDPEISRYTKDD
jgi:CRP/FNR family transcriptional regulator, cyclic AMP receptor protein